MDNDGENKNNLHKFNSHKCVYARFLSSARKHVFYTYDSRHISRRIRVSVCVCEFQERDT